VLSTLHLIRQIRNPDLPPSPQRKSQKKVPFAKTNHHYRKYMNLQLLKLNPKKPSSCGEGGEYHEPDEG